MSDPDNERPDYADQHILKQAEEIKRLQSRNELLEGVYATGLAYEDARYHDTWRAFKDALAAVEEGQSSEFSEFIRNASPEEKERVYSKVMDEANEAQNAAVEDKK